MILRLPCEPEGAALNLAERSLVILKYVKKVPILASCAKCQRKFFTPNSYNDDSWGAEQYLRAKFDAHVCREEPETRR